jgi:hypothetical protein
MGISGDPVGQQGQGTTVLPGVVAVVLPLPEKGSGAEFRAVMESEIEGCHSASGTSRHLDESYRGISP